MVIGNGLRLAGVVAALLFGGLPLAAQSWQSLEKLNRGDRVQVLDTAGQEHKGTFASVSADAIAVETTSGQISVERTRVRRVQVRSASRRIRNAVIGAAIGLAIGVIVDQTAGTYLRNEVGEDSGARALTYAAPIALGGGLGALPAWRTVYRQP